MWFLALEVPGGNGASKFKHQFIWDIRGCSSIFKVLGPWNSNLRTDSHCFLPNTQSSKGMGRKQTIWQICNLIFWRSMHNNKWTGNNNKVVRQSWYRAPLSRKFSFWHSDTAKDSRMKFFSCDYFPQMYNFLKRLQRFTVRKFWVSIIRLWYSD